jgi:hypothetical protein
LILHQPWIVVAPRFLHKLFSSFPIVIIPKAPSGRRPPYQGRIEVEGCEVGWAGLRRGVVFQEYALFQWRACRRYWPETTI